MAAIVEVKLELGHRAKVRDVPSEEGHTHDWIVFVKGSGGIKLEHFVEKIVFWLHESYDPSKRVIRRPPYKVEESGFAGFIILIDVHFRNHEEPKMVRFQYDLFLLTESMPPVNHTRVEKLTFANPTEDFRKKILKAGAVLISPPPSVSRHSSKDRSNRASSPPPKKDRSRSKDSSKHRDGSSHRSQDEKKRSSSAHSIRKDGRIPGKEMKKHEEEFKHPKPPDSGRTQKDSTGSDKVEHERGRPEKRKSIADDDGNKKKKKKRSDDHSSQQSRPKSLSVSSGSGPQNPPKKEKDKVRKIREKPDMMAGLFAPENSINMTQIKQSKEKAKHEANEAKLKKEKKTTPDVTPSRRSVSPHPNQEDGGITHTLKISPGGNLTLKIKKERITSVEEKKKESSNQLLKPAKKESSEKEKKRSKDSSESSKIKMKEKDPEPRKRTPIASSSSSSSSSSGSDMDISSNGDSSAEKSNHSKSKKAINTSGKVEEAERKPKLQIQSKDSHKVVEKPEKKVSKSSREKERVPEKVKMERERSKDSSKTSIERHEKSRRDSSSHKEKSSSSTKHKKSSRDERTNISLDKSNPEKLSQKPKKRSSKDKSIRQPSKERRVLTPTPTVKKDQHNSMSGSTPTTERISVKKEPLSQTPSPSSFHVAAGTKSRKSPKPSSMPLNEKDKSRQKQNSVHKKSSSSSSSTKYVPKQDEKSKIVFKSASFVKTSSASDNVTEPPLKHASPDVKRKEYLREASLSSQSSSSSEEGPPDMSPNAVDKNPHAHPQQERHRDPAVTRPSSNSDSSDDEEMAMRDFPSNTSTLSVISPIRDQSSSYEGNPGNSATAYQDMVMSDSSDDSNMDHSHKQDNIRENRPPSAAEDAPCQPLQNIGIVNDDYTSSSEENGSPPEKPFQNHQDSLDQDAQSSTSHHEDAPNVIILTGSNGQYPNMTEPFYRELQELQRRISFVTDVDRLRKIARIVAKSQKLLKNDDYFDFDLCSLDQRTIHKIKKQLEAV